ncbi:DeoR family transcriptional regulator [Anseongella ginsenosidimutans]|uniref:DeoR family transcriptional regulator n=1 Tax=Anseongella ginsenosidimutans TaxID=496056 RepID=A0A4R3KP86_9SPHI|nr:DeoR/GlpR family DNA-binding transcription regulator [Anseongella ginsenosidimutans]TCS85992.1 DeoR family transcriptional regulator [Anseongella ginsenosidimutans]
MLNITERHQFILQRLKESGRVSIQELSDLMEVSGVTIRKDLKLLEEKNLLFRTRGGGSLNNPYAVERPINEKELINAEEKQKIARAAVDLVGDNDSIIIGSGTTAFGLARYLYPPRHLTVITPAVKVTLELCNRPNVEVMQLGGLVRPSSSSVAGFSAEHTLEDISCGLLFLGVDGIDLEFGLSITNFTEASLNQKMIESARAVVVLADSSKFGKRGLGRVCGLDQVHYIVTDNAVSSQTVELLEERGVKVIVAG